MKKLVTVLCGLFAFFQLNAATPEKYFTYDLAGKQILNTAGVKGDYIVINEVDIDALENDGITEIEFPSEIEGCKVIAICGMVDDWGNIQEVTLDSRITKVSFPETYEVIVLFCDKSTKTEFTGTTTKPLYFGVKPFAGSNELRGTGYLNEGLPQAGRKVYFPSSESFMSKINIEGIETLTVSKNWIFDTSLDYAGGYSGVRSGSIKELIFEEGCTGVCKWECKGTLEKVTLAKSIKVIVTDAFTYHSNLKEVVVPAGAVYKYPDNYNIGYFSSVAFKGCSLSIKTKSAVKATGYNGEF